MQTRFQNLPGRVPGYWYLDHYTFDAAGNVTYTTHLVTGHMHTHTSGEDTPSDFDRDFAGADGSEFEPGNTISFFVKC